MRLSVCCASIMAGLCVAMASSDVALAQDKALQPLAINYALPNALWWNIDVAIDKGFLKGNGFAPEAIPFQNSPQAVQLLVSKSVQAIVVQPEALLDANRRGAGLAAIAQTESRPDWFLVVAPAVKDWTDIKNKNIGFSSLKVNEVWLTEKLLSAHGLKKGDWNALQVGITPLKVAALTKGSIAAAPLFQPGAQQAMKDGLKPIARYDELADYPPSLVVVSRAWAAENHNGQRFGHALQQAHQWLSDPANRSEAQAILSKYTKAAPDVAQQVYEILFITDKIYSRDGAVDLQGLKRALQLVADAGEIPADKLPSPESLVLSDAEGGLKH
jgi:ABC-type nitrate/sulfonate/bicarbonate transport system substrate-binding protein